MEELNKHQLILLVLLVSFVTSIATGIITFTLLQEAPVEVTQTINRVVERTIEKVTPVEVEGGKTEVVREIQVVNEEDLVLESIEKSSKSIVRVKTIGADGGEVVTGLGVVVSNGVIVVDSRSVANGTSFKIYFADGKSYNTAKSWRDGELTYFNVGIPSGEKYSFYPASLGKASALKLGQTVIAVSGKESNAVTINRISRLEKTAEGAVSGIVTDIALAKSQRGSPLLNLNGEVVGIESPISEGDTALSYIPISKVQNSLSQALEELKK